MAWTLCAAMTVSACSNPKPVLYSNAHLQSVGKEVAEQDIEACRQMAEEAGAQQGSGKTGQVAKSTAIGGGVGAASGAVGGAISGSPGLAAPIAPPSGPVLAPPLSLFH